MDCGRGWIELGWLGGQQALLLFLLIYLLVYYIKLNIDFHINYDFVIEIHYWKNMRSEKLDVKTIEENVYW